MADIALGAPERIIKAVLAIKKAVRTVRQNNKDCQDIERCVDDVYALLSCLHQETDMMKNPAMRRPYDNLADSLEEALQLIERCQGRNALHRFLAAGDMAKHLRRVREDILLKLMLGNFANSVQITITLTRTIRCGGAHPLLTQTGDAGEVMDPCSWQLATDDARSEINSEITMETTASQVPHDPSSRLMEVNLPELEATMHQISEENISGGGGHSVAWKQKIVFKMNVTRERHRSRAMALAANAGGVSSTSLTGLFMDQLEVTGDGVDSVCLLKALRKKVGAADILKVYINDTQRAYETANVRRRSGTSLPPPLRIDPLPAASGVPSSHDVVTVSETAPPTTEEELELLHDDHHASC